MKYYFSMSLLLLMAAACTQKNEYKLLATEYFKYSAYSWHIGEDSVSFYLSHCLNIDMDGNFILMRRDTFMAAPKYSSGQINDTLRNFINAIFLAKRYEHNYLFKTARPMFYDGFTYCIDYKKPSAPRQVIQFIPSKSPAQIQQISLLFDTLIYSKAATKIDAFDTDSYKIELDSISKSAGLKVPNPMLPPRVVIKRKKRL